MALAMAFAVCAPSAEGLAEKAPASPASVRVGALGFTVPKGFSRHTVKVRGHFAGVLVADYPVRAVAFPPHGVVLLVGLAQGPPSLLHRVAAVAPRLLLPLTLAELQGPQRHPDGTAWNRTLRFNGTVYVFSFWVGRAASSHDRTALLDALNLIRVIP